ncbi:hypothetical protein [Paraburkholderia youngii]|uniref:hypothetical protein n=1 Tax=Paraburkholderia youngii TaxID=2782701 RepID=UPI003D232420
MTLHLYAQEQEHDDAFVVGTRESLVALRKAIENALEGKSANRSSDSMAEFTAADGECYDLYIKVVPESLEYKLSRPYAQPRRESDNGHWDPRMVPTE